jgi:hypothetical protein
MCRTTGYYQVLGSPQQPFDTVEVWGSSPHGPTIIFSELASTTSLGQAPIGSIKEVVRDSQGSSRLWAQTVEKDAPAS